MLAVILCDGSIRMIYHSIYFYFSVCAFFYWFIICENKRLYPYIPLHHVLENLVDTRLLMNGLLIACG